MVGSKICGFSDNMLLPWFKGAGHLIIESATTASNYLAILSKADLGGRAEKEGLELLAHFCCKQYRTDVLLSLYNAGDLRPKAKALRQEDKVVFSKFSLSQVSCKTLNFVGSQGRTAVKSPDALFAFMWTTDKNYGMHTFNRQKMVNRNYYTLMLQVNELIRIEAPHLQDTWKSTLYRVFFKHHNVIPYPATNGSLINMAKKQGLNKEKDLRQMFAVGPIDETYREFKFLGDKPLNSQPPVYPPACKKRGDSLRNHISWYHYQDQKVHADIE